MAKAKRKKAEKAGAGEKATGAKAVRAPADVDLDGLRKAAGEAKERFNRATEEARKLEEKATAMVAEAKRTYLDAILPYREACRRTGTACEFQGARQPSVAERVSFLVEKTKKGVRVMIKGRPDTEEVIPFAELEESLNRVAYGFVERHVGPREQIGNKGGGLSNRLRAVLQGG